VGDHGQRLYLFFNEAAPTRFMAEPERGHFSRRQQVARHHEDPGAVTRARDRPRRRNRAQKLPLRLSVAQRRAVWRGDEAAGRRDQASPAAMSHSEVGDNRG